MPHGRNGLKAEGGSSVRSTRCTRRRPLRSAISMRCSVAGSASMEVAIAGSSASVGAGGRSTSAQESPGSSRPATLARPMAAACQGVTDGSKPVACTPKVTSLSTRFCAAPSRASPCTRLRSGTTPTFSDAESSSLPGLWLAMKMISRTEASASLMDAGSRCSVVSERLMSLLGAAATASAETRSAASGPAMTATSPCGRTAPSRGSSRHTG